MKKSSSIAVLSIILGFVAWSNNQASSFTAFNFGQKLCLSEFYQNTAPELINEKLKVKSYPLCFEGFTLNFSGVSKTPLWVAEKLSPQRLARKIAREDNFHEESRLPEQVRSRLDDYRGSGYDRGHMAPNGDMSNKVSQYDSFSLANIIPQVPDNNQNTWRELEEATRAMVSKYRQDAYIITGPAFLRKKIAYIKPGHRIMVPTHVYKVVYFPKIAMASVYISKNDSSRSVEIISICALEERTGINFFPTLAENVKRQVFALPTTAKQVKANQQLRYIKNDLQSQCATTPTEQQIKQTQQQFLQQHTYNRDILSSTKEPAVGHLGQLLQTIDWNQVLIMVLNFIKNWA